MNYSILHAEEQFSMGGFKDISPTHIGAVDIETTGVNHKTSVTTILGITHILPNEQVVTKQFFLNDKTTEEALYNEYLAYIQEHNIKCMVTFNGDSFDIPYMDGKLAFYNKLSSFERDCTQVDIYKWAKKYSNAQVKHQKMNGVSDKDIRKPFGERLNLKGIEKFVGIDREDTVYGVTMISKYNEYEFLYKAYSDIENGNLDDLKIRLALIKSNNYSDLMENMDELKNKIVQDALSLREELLLHNREDTYNLLKLFASLLPLMNTQ